MIRTAVITTLMLFLGSLSAFAGDQTIAPSPMPIGAVSGFSRTSESSQTKPGIEGDRSRVTVARHDTMLRETGTRLTSRPAALPVLYGSLFALQAFDVYSTRTALSRGAQEANPVMSGIVGNPIAFTAVKAATAAIPMLIAERMWKNNRAAAVLTMVAANSAMALVAANNARVMQRMR